MGSAFSPEQIAQYLSYISLPAKYHPANRPALDIKFLTALHVHQIAKIPYDNLTLHYSASHKIVLDPPVVFKKVVTDARGRGGYCMENSIFYNHILRALGFQAYLAGVRIRPRVNGIPQGDYMGWSHVVNIVTLSDGTKWMVDVAFGGDGATKPLPLIDGAITKNIGTQELRLIYDNIPQQVDRSRKLWIYQYRNGSSMDWNSFYSFAEMEFLHNDFRVMNWFTGSSPDSFQTFTVMLVKFLRTEADADHESVIYGKVIMVNGDVKINDTGKTRLVRTCQTEDERIEALKEYFGITLTEEERGAIKGFVTELKGNDTIAMTG